MPAVGATGNSARPINVPPQGPVIDRAWLQETVREIGRALQVGSALDDVRHRYAEISEQLGLDMPQSTPRA